MFAYLHVDRVAIQAIHRVIQVLSVVPFIVLVLDHFAHIPLRVVRQVTCRWNPSVHLGRRQFRADRIARESVAG